MDQIGQRLLVGERRGSRQRTSDIIQPELAQLVAKVLVVAGRAGAHGQGRLEPQPIPQCARRQPWVTKKIGLV